MSRWDLETICWLLGVTALFILIGTVGFFVYSHDIKQQEVRQVQMKDCVDSGKNWLYNEDSREFICTTSEQLYDD